jgi:large subunit ribosomal protein L17
MRHQISHSHFNRDANHRKALLKNLVRALVEQGFVVTTTAKAKELKRLADKIIHQAQDQSVSNRRVLHRFFGRRDVVNTLVERVAPAMSDRSSGFTRTEKIGSRRGDNAELTKVSLIAEVARIGSLKSGNTYEAKPAKAKVAKTTKPAAKAKPAESKPAEPSSKKTSKTTNRAQLEKTK